VSVKLDLVHAKLVVRPSTEQSKEASWVALNGRENSRAGLVSGRRMLEEIQAAMGWNLAKAYYRISGNWHARFHKMIYDLKTAVKKDIV